MSQRVVDTQGKGFSRLVEQSEAPYGFLFALAAVGTVGDSLKAVWLWGLVALCSDEEIRGILDSDLECAPDEEIAALTFAQHYANMKDKPSRQAIKNLVAVYGLSASKEILTHIRMISIGNLSGNTAEAFLSRVNGKPPKEGNFLLEFLFYFFASPMFKKMRATN